MSVNFDRERFLHRHIGSSPQQIDEMLSYVGFNSLDSLIEKAIPKGIHRQASFGLDEPMSETRFLDEFKKMMSKNEIYSSFIGMGYYDTILPNVIKRNILENPGWYTSYTPYQAEIAQG